MATSYTSLLGLALPVTGELAGTWGDTVNNSITSLLDTAIAGTTTLSTDADVTLSTTTGASNQARQAILLCSGLRSALRTITAPAQSKIYAVVNNTTGGFAVKIVGAGPTTGVTVANGKTAIVIWNGSDFVEVAPATATTATNLAGGAAGSVPYQTGAGVTTFLSLGTAAQVLQVNAGATAPEWVSSTGTGNVVRATSPTIATPTFTTSATFPLHIGGTGTTSTLTLRSTSGVGTTGADIIFQTGNNGATEAMRILNSGNVGIGTNAPAYLLDVLGVIRRYQAGSSASPVEGMRLEMTGNGAVGRGFYISFYGPNGGTASREVARVNGFTNAGTDNGGYLSFDTASAGTGTNAERMRITSAGDVSIGTTTPTSTLTVAGTFNTTGNVTLGDASTDTVTVNGYMGVGTAPDPSIAILAGSTALTSTTQHGVYSIITGTSAATSIISGFTSLPKTAAAVFTVTDVYGYRASNATLGAGSTITNQHGVYIADQTRGTNNYGITSLVSLGTNKWNIYASGTANNYLAGALGIGTTAITTDANSVADNLVIKDAGSAGLTITSPDANNATLAFGSASSNNYFYLQGFYNSGSPFVRFSISASEKMRLDASGNVLIGTTASQTISSITGNLQVETANASSAITLVRNTANALAASLAFGKSRGAALGSRTAVISGDNLGLISFDGADGTNMVDAAYIIASVDNTPGSNDMPGRLTFWTTADGGSTPTERLRIDSSGNVLVTSTGGLGYGTGSGGAVTQATSRTTGVTLDKTNGAITLVSAAGTTTWQSFTVTNNKVTATDTVIVNQKSGTDLYQIFVTNVAAGSFKITFATTGGTTTEQPVFNFAVIKAVTA